MGDELIDGNNPVPKYIQLREILRARIEEGEYLPGAAIPSESELVEEFGIHRLTVRNAINSLTLEGQLKPVQGKGVFVVGKKSATSWIPCRVSGRKSVSRAAKLL